MSSVTRNGGLGGFWPKPNRNAGANLGKGPGAKGGQPVDSARFSGTKPAGINAADRLAQLAGAPANPLEPRSASDLVRQSPDLATLVKKSLKHALGSDVNLGAHEEALLAYVRNGLAASNLSFEDIKRRQS